MARKPIKHVRIQREKLRKSTLKKRFESLCKKATELSILCYIDVFIILLNREDGSSTLWPSRDEVIGGIRKFLDFSEQEMQRKMDSQEKLLVDKVQETYEKLVNLRKKNEETEMRILLKQVLDRKDFSGLSLDQRNGLNRLIDEDMKRLQKRKEELDEAERGRSGTSGFAEGNQGGAGTSGFAEGNQGGELADGNKSDEERPTMSSS